MKTCLFCENFSKRGGIISQSDGFNIIADAAPMAEGHILIVPQEHIKSFSNLSQKQLTHVKDLISIWVNILKKSYSVDSFIVAEHGMGIDTTSRRCGIDHAHIHIVPIKHSIEKVALEIYKKKYIPSIEKISKYKNNNYFFLDSNQFQPRMYFDKSFEPQLFRRTMALTLDTDEFDWGVMLDYKKAKETTLFLKKQMDQFISKDL